MKNRLRGDFKTERNIFDKRLSEYRRSFIAIDVEHVSTENPKQFGENNMCCLTYADDVLVLAESENDKQYLLNFVHDWCRKWQLMCLLVMVSVSILFLPSVRLDDI